MFSFFKKNVPGSLPAAGSNPLNYRDLTTKRIALWLLFTFIGSVVALMIINVVWSATKTADIGLGDDGRKDWFELLKNALILLGTALTTVIGYYFGQREGAIKEAEAKKEIEATNLQAKNIIKETTENRDKAVKSDVSKDSDPEDTEAPSRKEEE